VLLSMSGTDAPPSQWMMPHLISYVWHGHKPDVSHLRVWKCIAYVHVQKDKCNALASHYEKCAFIGSLQGYKGWKFYMAEYLHK